VSLQNDRYAVDILNRYLFWWHIRLNWMFLHLCIVRLFGGNLVIQFQDTRQWFDSSSDHFGWIYLWLCQCVYYYYWQLLGA